MPTLVALIPDTDPPFFGGGSAGTRPSKDTVYGSLRRSRHLPSLVMAFDRNKNKIASPRHKKLLRSLSSGEDLSIQWTFENGVLVLEAHYTGEDFVLSNFVVKAIFTVSDGIVYTGKDVWKPLGKKLSEADQTALAHRLLHFFLRAKGSSLDWDTMDDLCTHIKSYYTPLMKNEKWKFLLDLCMIRTDVAFTLQQSNCVIGGCLVGVGEALGTREKYKEAAPVYQDIVDAYARTIEEKATHQGNGALAWKRAGDYEASEQAYVKTLRLHSSTKPLDFDDEHTKLFLGNLILMYYEWNLAVMRLGEASEIFWVDSLVIALLYTVGVQIENTNAVPKFGPSCLPMLAPQFKSKDAAKQAIALACNSSSVSIFRSRVLSCKDPNCKSFTFTQVFGPQKDKKHEKKMARQTARANHFCPRICGRSGCCNQEPPEGQGLQFQCCPCRNMYYCQKSCQIADWKVHKLSCDYYAEKKRNKKK